MKRCPVCNRTYTDATLRFCLEDGTPLTQDQSSEPTIAMPGETPPTVAFNAQIPASAAPPAWTPMAPPKPKRKVWPWVLGAFLLICVLGGGFIALLIGLASLSSDSTNSTNSTNANTANVNRIANANIASPSPKTKPTNVEITKAYLAKDNGSGEPGDEAESFSASDRTIHCIVELDHPAEGTAVKFDWIAVDAGELKDNSIKQLDYTTKALEKKIHAHLTSPRDWLEGDYKVDVYLNDQLAKSITYKVE
jgi:hypothetical protein